MGSRVSASVRVPLSVQVSDHSMLASVPDALPLTVHDRVPSIGMYGTHTLYSAPKDASGFAAL